MFTKQKEMTDTTLRIAYDEDNKRIYYISQKDSNLDYIDLKKLGEPSSNICSDYDSYSLTNKSLILFDEKNLAVIGFSADTIYSIKLELTDRIDGVDRSGIGIHSKELRHIKESNGYFVNSVKNNICIISYPFENNNFYVSRLNVITSDNDREFSIKIKNWENSSYKPSYIECQSHEGYLILCICEEMAFFNDKIV